MRNILLVIFFLLLASPVLATTITLQDGVDGYDGTTDSFIKKDAADTNYSSEIYLTIQDDYVNYYIWPIIKFDVSSIPIGSTINSAVLSIYMERDIGGACTVSAYRIFKPWTESGVTWNDWITPNSEWGTSGCANASDAGSDNNSDGSGYDRVNTASANYSKGSWEGMKYETFTITELVDGWVNETMTNNGVLIKGNGSCNMDGETSPTHYTSSEGTAAQRPKLVIDYTEGSSPSGRRVITIQ